VVGNKIGEKSSKEPNAKREERVERLKKSELNILSGKESEVIMTDTIISLDINSVVNIFTIMALIVMSAGSIMWWIWQPVEELFKIEVREDNFEADNGYVERLIGMGRNVEAMAHVRTMKKIAVEQGNSEAIRVYETYESRLKMLMMYGAKRNPKAA